MKPRFRQIHYNTFLGPKWHWKPVNEAAHKMMDKIYMEKGLRALGLIYTNQ